MPTRRLPDAVRRLAKRLSDPGRVAEAVTRRREIAQLHAEMAQLPALRQELERSEAARRQDHAVMAEAICRLRAQLEELDRLYSQLPGSVRPTRLLGAAIDHPASDAVLSADAIVLTGWAVCEPAPLSSVLVSLSGVPGQRRARLGIPRADVAESVSHPAAHVSGFECRIDLPASGSRAHEVSLTASVSVSATDGSLFHLPPHTIRIGSPVPEPLPRSVWEPGTVAAAPSGVTDRSGLHVAFATHHLGLGGAQLRLQELLQHFAGVEGVDCRVLAPGDGELRPAIEKLGIRVELTGTMPVGDPDDYEQALAALGARIAAAPTDVLFANTLVAFPAVDAATRLGIPSIWDIHESLDLPDFWRTGFPWNAPVTAYVQGRARRCFTTAAAILVEAAASRRIYERYGQQERFAVLRNRIDVTRLTAQENRGDRAAARSELGLAEDERLVLCPGILTPRKGQALLCSAAAVLHHDFPDVHWAAVGDMGGAYAESLKRYVAGSAWGQHVHVLAATPSLHRWYAAADLVVIPSERETLPGVIYEATAFGVPLVSTNVGGIPEVLTDDETAFLCPPSDVRALAERLSDALRAPEEDLSRMVDAAQARIDELPDAQERARLIEGLLRDVVRGPAEVPSTLRAIDDASEPADSAHQTAQKL